MWYCGWHLRRWFCQDRAFVSLLEISYTLFSGQSKASRVPSFNWTIFIIWRCTAKSKAHQCHWEEEQRQASEVNFLLRWREWWLLEISLQTCRRGSRWRGTSPWSPWSCPRSGTTHAVPQGRERGAEEDRQRTPRHGGGHHHDLQHTKPQEQHKLK